MDLTNGLPYKFKFPSQQFWEALDAKYKLSSSPVVNLVVLGKFQHTTGNTVTVTQTIPAVLDEEGNEVTPSQEVSLQLPEMIDVAGWHVDMIVNSEIELPEHLVQFQVNPDQAKHTFGGRTEDEQLVAELAPSPADLEATFDDVPLTITEEMELAGQGIPESKREARALRRSAQLAVLDARQKRDGLLRSRLEAIHSIQALNATKDELQAARTAAIARRQAAVDLIQTGITGEARQEQVALRDAATEERAALNARLDEVNAQIADAVGVRDSLVQPLADANAALASAKAAKNAL